MHASYDDDDRHDGEKTIHPCFMAEKDADGEGARPSSLISVHRPAVIDPLHELNLCRMLQIANERTLRDFGPLSLEGLSVNHKRKPVVPYRDFLGCEVHEKPSTEENNEMKLSQLAVATALTAGVMTGCADPRDPTLNPHPKHRYEITLTIEGAPGPFQSVTGYLYYSIANSYECAPQDPFTGVYESGPGYRPPITFHRIGENIYRGVVYLDTVRDESYYGRGVCHWAFNGVAVALEANGVTFGTGMAPEDIASQRAVSEYMPKRLYVDLDAQAKKMHFGMESLSDEIAAHRHEYFSTTLMAKEDTHE